MGGQAFSSGPDALYTPRMKPGMYKALRSHYQSKLRELFVYVASPIEGPGKVDFGDIDILVALERRLVFPGPDDSKAGPETVSALRLRVAEVLGAERTILTPGDHASCNLAVSWPSDLDDSTTSAPVPKRHVQVDVTICASLEEVEFKLFKWTHADTWNLLGSIIRPYGLTVDEEALWLRIPEIEVENRKRARVHVTADPVEILHFLGLRIEGFWVEPLGSLEEMYEYAATCRLFWVREARDGVCSAQDAGDDQKSQQTSNAAAGNEQLHKKLKAIERRRQLGRPNFRRWFDEFIPKCRAEGRYLAPPDFTRAKMRDRVRDEAFAYFPHLGPACAEAMRSWRRENDVKGMKMLIKGELPPAGPASTNVASGPVLDPSFRGCIVKALRKIIVEDDDSFGTVPSTPLKDEHGVYDLEATRRFVRDHWEHVGRVAWDTQVRQKIEKRMQGVKRSAEEE